MAQEIRFRADPEKGEVYGEHTLDGVTTLHCIAELYEDDVLIAQRMLVGIPFENGEADRDAKAQAAFKDFAPGASPETKPSKPDTTKWSATISKAE
jgi:hypothetical protein